MFYFVRDHACDGQTDGQTDRILIARPRLHFMQRGKNGLVVKSLFESRHAVTSRILAIRLDAHLKMLQ